MNTAKVARYLPAFYDMLRHLNAEPSRDLVSMMENQLRAELLLSGYRHSIALRDLDNPTQVFNFVGCPTQDHLHDFVPNRVFAWAQRQLPALLPDEARWLLPAVGWQARLQAAPTATAGQPGQPVPTAGASSVYIECQVSPDEVAVLGRGLRAHLTKRRKAARRLLAQLWALHWQQQRSRATAAVGSQEGGQPV